MRLELKEGINHSYIIDDAYNNDLQGAVDGAEFSGTTGATEPENA